MSDEQTLATAALTLEQQARAIQIRDAASLDHAAELLRSVKALGKEIVDFFAPLKKKAHDAHKALTTAEAEKLAPLTSAERVIKGRLAAYEEEQERARVAEERRLQEEAKRREEDARLAEAAALESAGAREEAASILAEPIVAPVVQLARPASPKGISYRERRFAVVTDLPTLVAAVAAGTVPIQALLPNQAFLDNQARALGTALVFPGVSVGTEKIVSASAR